MKIGYLTSQPSYDTWIANQLKDAPFTAVFQAGTADAYVVCAESAEEGKTFLSVFQHQKPVFWIGEFADEAKKKGAFKTHTFSGDEDELDAEFFISSAYELYEELTRMSSNTESPNSNRTRIRFSSSPAKREGSTPSAMPEPATTVPPAPSASLQDIMFREHVIAVGGFRGCGASTVAWNLAHLLEATLLEGRRTSSLSAWTGDKTPAIQALASTLLFGTCADSQLTEGDLMKISSLTVIDVGSDVDHPAWKHAKQRIWVTTVDVQCVGSLPPSLTKLVLNRVPLGWPMKVEDVCNRVVDLLIHDLGREFLLAGYKQQPWIAKQPQSVKNEWIRLTSKHHRSMPQHGEEDIQW